VIVVDFGDITTQFVSIFDGYNLLHDIGRLYLGSKDLTEYMIKLLKEIG
jgi:actin-related protein